MAELKASIASSGVSRKPISMGAAEEFIACRCSLLCQEVEFTTKIALMEH